MFAIYQSFFNTDAAIFIGTRTDVLRKPSWETFAQVWSVLLTDGVMEEARISLAL